MPAAVAVLREILEEDPNNVKALLALGAFTSNSREGAIALERALRLDPHNDLARRALAEHRARRQQHQARPGGVEPAAEREPGEATPPDSAPPEPELAAPPAPAEVTVALPEDHLRVVEGSSYLLDQERRAYRLRTTLGTLLVGLLAVAVVVGLAPAFAVIFGLGNISTTWVIAGLLLVGAVWLAAPEVGQLRNEWKNFQAGRLGEERLATSLQQHLSGDWVLFRNVLLSQGSGDIDAVLVGPKGVFALEVKAYTGYHRNVGKRWQRRAYGRWHTLDRSPTRQALRNAVDLSMYLESRGVDVWVEARVVWAKESSLWLEKPAVPVWQLSDPAYLLEDIESQKALPEEVVRETVRALDERGRRTTAD
jgi:hypothetical protein